MKNKANVTRKDTRERLAQQHLACASSAAGGSLRSPVRRLLRMEAFEGNRVHGKYWQVIIDEMQLESSRKKLDKRSLFRVHKRGTPCEPDGIRKIKADGEEQTYQFLTNLGVNRRNAEETRESQRKLQIRFV